MYWVHIATAICSHISLGSWMSSLSVASISITITIATAIIIYPSTDRIIIFVVRLTFRLFIFSVEIMQCSQCNRNTNLNWHTVLRHGVQDVELMFQHAKYSFNNIACWSIMEVEEPLLGTWSVKHLFSRDSILNILLTCLVPFSKMISNTTIGKQQLGCSGCPTSAMVQIT